MNERDYVEGWHRLLMEMIQRYPDPFPKHDPVADITRFEQDLAHTLATHKPEWFVNLGMLMQAVCEDVDAFNRLFSPVLFSQQVHPFSVIGYNWIVYTAYHNALLDDTEWSFSEIDGQPVIVPFVEIPQFRCKNAHSVLMPIIGELREAPGLADLDALAISLYANPTYLAHS